jgi:hypothetical protein
VITAASPVNHAGESRFRVVPSLHVAIQRNLTTHKAVRTFHERLMKYYAVIFIVQLFLVAVFVWPAATNDRVATHGC